MNEQELNKKLAEWAGCGMVVEHSGTWAESWHYPDFTNSLDACFKWLKAQVIAKYDYPTWKRLLYDWVDDITLKQSDYEALNLCLAIEKLIDGGKQ